MQRFNRSARTTLLVTIGALALFGAFVLWAAAGPSDGTRVNPEERAWRPEGVRVAVLDARPGGLQDGDVVTAVEGVPLEHWAGALLCLRPACRVERPPRAAGTTLVYTVERGGRTLDVPVTLGRYPLREVLRRGRGVLLVLALNFLVLLFVFLRRPGEPAAQAILLSTTGLLGSMPWAFGLQVGDLLHPPGFWMHLLATGGTYLLGWTGALHFSLVFPRRHPLAARHRWLIPAVHAVALAAFAVFAVAARLAAGSVLGWLAVLGPGQSIIVIVYLLAAVIAGLSNYPQLKDPVARQQVRVVVFAGSLVGLVAVFGWGLPQLVTGTPLLRTAAISLIGLLLPLAIAVSIFRYRLWDIDIIINRTLVYLALTVGVVALYVGVVSGLGALLQARGRLLPSLAATGAVAVAFQPLRGFLQRAVNRMMYGERDEPYAVLSRLGRRLEGAFAPDAVLATIVETVSQALKLPYAAVLLREGDRFREATAAGQPVENPIVLPLRYQGAVVGRLLVGSRGPGERFNPAERRLLQDVAHQAGVAVHAVQLTADLQRSRQRIVTTREEERRRLRRDLHDGLGATLAALHLQTGTVRRLIRSDPDAAEALLEDFRQEIRGTIEEVRRLVYELRPPALDELGLADAIRSRAARLQASGPDEPQLHIVVDAPADLTGLSAATEVAAYRIVQEALTNVVRHARARLCTVRLWQDGGLHITVEDDGVGLPVEPRAGVGLSSMAERAAELGGWCRVASRPDGETCVEAYLPLAEGA